MSDLIPVFNATFGGFQDSAIDARKLHAFLEVRSEFRNWIKNRISDYKFTQDIDFVAGNFIPESDRIDYFCTINMAKMLAAAENNDKGRSALQILLKNSITTVDELFDLLADVDVPEAPNLYVYAIREQETGKLKLGISKNPHQRMKQLQTANPNRLELVAAIPAPNRFKDESRMHHEASEHRIHGEWFKSSAINSMEPMIKELELTRA